MAKKKLKKAVKFDQSKVRLELVPPELELGAGRGFTYGAKKYSDGNWASGDGLEWSRAYGALKRHLGDFWMGVDYDPESGLHHLDHAACCLAFLMAYKDRELGKDDRVIIGASSGKSTKLGVGSKRKLAVRNVRTRNTSRAS